MGFTIKLGSMTHQKSLLGHGRQSHAAPASCLEGLPWAWNTSLTKREKALQPVPVILLCFGIDLSCSRFPCVLFVLLGHLAHGSLALRHVPTFWISNPCGRGSPAAEKGPCTISPVLLWAVRQTRQHGRMDMPAIKAALACLFTLGKHCSIQSLCKFPSSWPHTCKPCSGLTPWYCCSCGGNRCYLLPQPP